MSTYRGQLTGVFIGSHAVAEGFITKAQLRRRGYRRLVHSVYADPSLEYDHRLRARGVALLLPPGTAIGGHSAAAWWGAAFARTTDPVTVISPHEVRWTGPKGVRVHRTTVRAGDVQVVDDVPVTSPARTAWDVMALESVFTAVAALDAMVRATSLTMAEVAVMPERGSGRWGAARVRRAVPLVDPRAESPPESWVRVALVLAGLQPEPQYEVFAGGRFVARVDLAWPEARLAVEYEGEHHFTDTQIDVDQERLDALHAAGWRVIRLSAADLRDLAAVVARVRAALAAS